MLFVYKDGALYLFIRWLEICCAAGLVFCFTFYGLQQMFGLVRLLSLFCVPFFFFRDVVFPKTVAYFRAITALLMAFQAHHDHYRVPVYVNTFEG